MNLTTTNNLDFGSTHIVEPHVKRYQKQFELLPILEDLTHIVKMPRTLVFHNKRQWHIWIQRYLIIGWFLKHTKSSLEFSVSMNKPPHLGMFYAIHVILYHFFVQVMVFCHINYAHFIEIEVKLTHTLVSYVAYWQHLDMAWPQQAPTKGVDTFKI